MENKKREVREGDDDDEMKMEKFYSLLRSFRHARDVRRRELELEQHQSNRKRMKAKPEVSFEFQDFTADIHFRKPPLVFPNPIPCDTSKDNQGKNKNEQQQDHGLDLQLAL
ncbi:hypothetical protein VNO78_20634 [Psophocarpus tetragonolobus]|uniref:Uncharacterized protein n=1 Tax=Psophocarpus tetragonolobus TaxID=3891 RepID=A0AAN9SBB0_PSOTE